MPPPVAVMTATSAAAKKPRPVPIALLAPTRTQTPMNSPSMTWINMVARLATVAKIQPSTAPNMA